MTLHISSADSQLTSHPKMANICDFPVMKRSTLNFPCGAAVPLRQIRPDQRSGLPMHSNSAAHLTHSPRLAISAHKRSVTMHTPLEKRPLSFSYLDKLWRAFATRSFGRERPSNSARHRTIDLTKCSLARLCHCPTSLRVTWLVRSDRTYYSTKILLPAQRR